MKVITLVFAVFVVGCAHLPHASWTRAVLPDGTQLPRLGDGTSATMYARGKALTAYGARTSISRRLAKNTAFERTDGSIVTMLELILSVEELAPRNPQFIAKRREGRGSYLTRVVRVEAIDPIAISTSLSIYGPDGYMPWDEFYPLVHSDKLEAWISFARDSRQQSAGEPTD
jgi:hypothetical protein